MSHTITLHPYAITFTCSPGETVLDAAVRAGVALRHGCRHGGCGACKVQLASGYVSHGSRATAISEAEEDSGLALLCCALPEEDVEINLPEDYCEAELTPQFPVVEREVAISTIAPVTRDIVHLGLALGAGESLGFRAGQYLEVQVPGTSSWRSFSLANAPGNNTLELLVKLMPEGLFSGHLRHRARVGDALRVRGPFGRFGAAATGAPMIMVAGGSGMAPVVALLKDLVARGSDRQVQFFYGARSRADLFWLDEIAALGRGLPSFTFTPALSEPDAADTWAGETGLITEVLARHTPANLRSFDGYLCGPPGMIDAAVEVLAGKGMFATRIACDRFLSTA